MGLIITYHYKKKMEFVMQLHVSVGNDQQIVILTSRLSYKKRERPCTCHASLVTMYHNNYPNLNFKFCHFLASLYIHNAVTLVVAIRLGAAKLRSEHWTMTFCFQLLLHLGQHVLHAANLEQTH